MDFEMIDSIVAENEYAVIEQLIDYYDKAWMIVEAYDGENYSAFQVFQEAKTENTKDGKKKGILAKLFGIIPSLFRMFMDRRKKKKIKHNNKALAKRLRMKKRQLRKANMSDDTRLILNAIANTSGAGAGSKEFKKIIRKQAVRRFMIKNGMRALIVGGVYYALNEKKQIIESLEQKAADKFDEAVLSKIKDAGAQAQQAINEATDAAVKKINAAIDNVKKLAVKAMQAIQKLYNTIRKYFHVAIGFDQANDIAVSYDPVADKLEVFFDIEGWINWVSLASKYIFSADKYTSERKQSEGDSAYTGKNVNERTKMSKNMASALEIDKLAKSGKHEYTYGRFVDLYEKLEDAFDKLAEHGNEVIAKYEKIQQRVQQDDKELDFIKSIIDNTRNILLVQTDVEASADAIIEYMESILEVDSDDSSDSDDAPQNDV